MNLAISYTDVQTAAERIKDHIHRTPVMSSRLLNEIAGAELFFKCENLQKVGAFKMRGATNAVFSLTDDEAQKGVLTHSSGNHAAALALAARKRGIKAWIVMPETAPIIKKKAVAGYGGEIVFCKPTQADRETTTQKIQQETGATFIHPYNNPKVISGQGTAALELLSDIDKLDYVITPVGGGGLLSGTAITVAHDSPQTLVIAGEPKGADDAYRSMISGVIEPSLQPRTICDGLLTSLGNLTFPIVQRLVHQIITVEDPVIIQAMRQIWTYLKIIVEPSAAVTLAAIIDNPKMFAEKRIGLILSGGNVDLDHLPW